MRRSLRVPMYAVFALTGFSALTLQVVWQRVISLHSGVDLVSFTTVVAAFLAGLGLGSLAGGALADRLGPTRSVRAFALANLAIGAFAAVSLWLFYDVYEDRAASLTTPLAKFAFNAALLAVPTTLMGLSLPLVAKGVVARLADAGPLVGRLYAVNTLGAAAGAAATGWLLLGHLGFAATVRLAGAANIGAALVVVAVDRLARRWGPGPGPAAAVAGPTDTDDDEDTGPVWPWYLVYALTGAVALGLEMVLFRLIDTVVRSNSYTFAHVLSLYLLLFGAGAAVASPLVARARRPGTWFLWIQYGVGVSALAGVLALTRGLPHTPWAAAAQAWFAREGFVVGFSMADAPATGLVPVLVGAPLVLMGLPVAGMGAAFPFAQALVARRMSTLGRRTGRLLFANVAGNVAGTLAAGFVVIDRLGTAGTYQLIGLALLVPGVVAAVHTGRLLGHPAWSVAGVVAATVLLVALVRWVPANEQLYARLHGVTPAAFHLVEDRSCAAGLRGRPSGVEEMTVNGASQNDYPFDDFHLVLGLTPALLHPAPRQVLAIGLGIGATPYGVTLDRRVEHLRTVEICGSEVPLLQDLAVRRSPELRRFFADPRVRIQVGDGRDELLRADRRYDVVVVDTLRPQAAFSGNVYSTEFYRLVHDRLSDEGLFAQWIPTNRTINSVATVFPHIMQFATPSYHGSTFLVAGKRPIAVDGPAMAARLAGEEATAGLAPERWAALDQFFRRLAPVCGRAGAPGVEQPGELVNRDLRPRDEYFLNQSPDVPTTTACQDEPGAPAPALAR